MGESFLRKKLHFTALCVLTLSRTGGNTRVCIKSLVRLNVSYLQKDTKMAENQRFVKQTQRHSPKNRKKIHILFHEIEANVIRYL